MYVPAAHPLSLPSANYARPFTPSFRSNDFNAVCLGAIEKTEGSHLFPGKAELLWICTHIAVLVPRGYRQHARNSRDVVDSRPPGSFTACPGFFLPSFLSFFLFKVFIVCRIVSYLEMCKRYRSVQSVFLHESIQQQLEYPFHAEAPSVICNLPDRTRLYLQRCSGKLRCNLQRLKRFSAGFRMRHEINFSS